MTFSLKNKKMQTNNSNTIFQLLVDLNNGHYKYKRAIVDVDQIAYKPLKRYLTTRSNRKFVKLVDKLLVKYNGEMVMKFYRCSICSHTYNTPYTNTHADTNGTPICGHTFCLKCIANSNSDRCPICNVEIGSKDMQLDTKMYRKCSALNFTCPIQNCMELITYGKVNTFKNHIDNLCHHIPRKCPRKGCSFRGVRFEYQNNHGAICNRGKIVAEQIQKSRFQRIIVSLSNLSLDVK